MVWDYIKMQYDMSLKITLKGYDDVLKGLLDENAILVINKSDLLRIGPKKDGGYVIDKRIINRTKILVTCGLNDDWEFERDYIKYNNETRVLAFDHTIDKNFWVKRLKLDLD